LNFQENLEFLLPSELFNRHRGLNFTPQCAKDGDQNSRAAEVCRRHSSNSRVEKKLRKKKFFFSPLSAYTFCIFKQIALLLLFSQ
jgi:hypothetical protein